MNAEFIRRVCTGCVHYVAVGNGVKGGLRSEKCFTRATPKTRRLGSSNMVFSMGLTL